MAGVGQQEVHVSSLGKAFLKVSAHANTASWWSGVDNSYSSDDLSAHIMTRHCSSCLLFPVVV